MGKLVELYNLVDIKFTGQYIHVILKKLMLMQETNFQVCITCDIGLKSYIF